MCTPRSALDSVTDETNDWHRTKLRDPLRDINWDARFICQEFHDGMGDVGRIHILKQLMVLRDLTSKICTELELDSVPVAYVKPEREFCACTLPRIYLTADQYQAAARLLSVDTTCRASQTTSRKKAVQLMHPTAAKPLKDLDVIISQQDQHPLATV